MYLQINRKTKKIFKFRKNASLVFCMICSSESLDFRVSNNIHFFFTKTILSCIVFHLIKEEKKFRIAYTDGLQETQKQGTKIISFF